MDAAWSPEQLERIEAADELDIAVPRADGTPGRWTPIWAVVAGEQVYVRTWQRRATGWFGRALSTRRARVRVPGLEADVTVADVGVGPAGLRAAVEAAYRAEYARYGRASIDPMVSDAAVATTLRLDPG